MLRRLYSHLRSERGSAAIETLISVPLLFIVILAFWSAAIVIYNQTTLNTATQSAAQGGLAVFDRQTYRRQSPSEVPPASGYINGSMKPSTAAVNAARSIFAENSRGMMREQYRTQSVPALTAPVSVSLNCAYNFNDIQNSSDRHPCGEAGAPVEHMQVYANVSGAYWLLGAVANRLDKSKDPCTETSGSTTCESGASPHVKGERQVKGMSSYGDAFSIGVVTP